MPDPITRDTLDLEALRKPQGHKYDHGHALVLTGGPGRTGAARLAARAALRIGAGAVTLGVPPAAQQEVACQITALMLRRIPDAAALAQVLEDRRINALCLGPGLGTGADRGEIVAAALESGRACVLDADALTLMASDPALFARLHAGCVLTPHMGEFARLFPDIAPRLTAGPSFLRAEGLARAADRAGCLVLLKGVETTLTAPGGAQWVHRATGDRAVPWLATAGAGDVLAGLVVGLMARGLAPEKAAGLATWLHVECALSCGPGLIAEDLPEALPRVLQAACSTDPRARAASAVPSSSPSA